MSRFVLKPARLVMDRLVPKKGTDLVVHESFPELCLAFPTEVGEWKKLGALRHGMFVGTCRSAKNPARTVIFLLLNPNRKGDLASVLKQDPTFASRLISAYRVEEAKYDGKIDEGDISAEQSP